MAISKQAAKAGFGGDMAGVWRRSTRSWTNSRRRWPAATGMPRRSWGSTVHPGERGICAALIRRGAGGTTTASSTASPGWNPPWAAIFKVTRELETLWQAAKAQIRAEQASILLRRWPVAADAGITALSWPAVDASPHHARDGWTSGMAAGAADPDAAGRPCDAEPSDGSATGNVPQPPPPADIRPITGVPTAPAVERGGRDPAPNRCEDPAPAPPVNRCVHPLPPGPEARERHCNSPRESPAIRDMKIRTCRHTGSSTPPEGPRHSGARRKISCTSRKNTGLHSSIAAPYQTYLTLDIDQEKLFSTIRCLERTFGSLAGVIASASHVPLDR